MTISRFLLDLQESYQRKVICLSSDGRLYASRFSGSRSSTRFASLLGPFGASIEFGDCDLPDDDSDDDLGAACPTSGTTGRVQPAEARPLRRRSLSPMRDRHNVAHDAWRAGLPRFA